MPPMWWTVFSLTPCFWGGTAGPWLRATLKWLYLTTRVMVAAARGDKEIVGSASVDYLMYSGYTMPRAACGVGAKAHFQVGVPPLCS